MRRASRSLQRSAAASTRPVAQPRTAFSSRQCLSSGQKSDGAASKAIAFAQGKAIYLTENEGSTYRKLFDTPGRVSWIRWSPDGQRLRFGVIDPKNNFGTTYQASRSGKANPLAMKLGGASGADRGIWTRDGKHFLFREDHNLRRDYFVARDGWLPFWSDRTYPFGGGGAETMAVAASPLEDTVFAVEREYSTLSFKFSPETRQLTKFLPEMSVMNPAFSPDGKWIVFAF